MMRWSAKTKLTFGWVVSMGFLMPTGGTAQDLADFDYENLSFRGVGLELGYLVPSRVEATHSLGVRMDLGYLGPGVRIIPGLSYWKSTFKDSEVSELEDRVASLVADQVGGQPPAVDLGVIDWSDIVLSLDAQVVWRVPFDALTFAGLGGSVHMLDGNGAAINGTFVEDLLDSVTAGLNLHTGVEVPVGQRVRVLGQARYEVMGDLQYFEIRLGGLIMTGNPAPGEVR
ncbi:MAG: hypothetical protein P8170_06425 [Gemmatimonadota bacterium]